MDSTPRRWVLRPLSPSLQPSDLRSISSSRDQGGLFTDSISIVGSQSAVHVDGHSDSSADVVVMARQVSVSQDHGSRRSSSSSEDLPISPCSSSSGASHSGFYSFVEDPFSPEAERNEAWMVSPQRQTQLSTLREANSYKLQSYGGHRQPGSLFQDESTDSQYKIDVKYGFKVVSEQEESQLRKEIIRSLAPKKSPLVEIDGGRHFGDETNRLIEGLSISYSRVSSRPSVVVDCEAINEEQINFDAARKQFLQMEQNKLDPIIRPRKVLVKTSVKQNVALQEHEIRREEQVSKPKVEEETDTEVKDDQSDSSQQSSVFEEISLNLGASFSSDDGLPSEQILTENTTIQVSTEYETPIEREIRIAQEREENLRRSRGLQQSVSGEMVEIKTKRFQSSLPLTPLRTKENSRVSFNFQEIQRKEDAIKQDSPGHDGRGPRFDILEASSTEMNQENTTTRAFETVRDIGGVTFDVVDYALQKQNTQGGSYKESENWRGSHQKLQEYVEPYLRNQAENIRYSKDQEHPKTGEVEGYNSPKERWQSPNLNVDRVENGYASVVERSSIEPISDDVFPMPCCPHKHPQEDSTQDTPSQWSPLTISWKNSLEKTGLQTRGQGAIDFIERDIEESLRREQELREQREARVKPVYSPQTLVQQADKMAATQFYPQTRTDKLQFRSFSSPRPITRLSDVPLMSPQPWSLAPHQTSQTPQTPQTSQTSQTPQTPQIPQTPQTPQTPGVVRTSLPVRGLTQTLLQDFEERRVKLKVEESAYAGIQPVDSVNNEVVESIRVTRHKNQRALQWEAGLFANQQDS